MGHFPNARLVLLDVQGTCTHLSFGTNSHDSLARSASGAVSERSQSEQGKSTNQVVKCHKKKKQSKKNKTDTILDVNHMKSSAAKALKLFPPNLKRRDEEIRQAIRQNLRGFPRALHRCFPLFSHVDSESLRGQGSIWNTSSSAYALFPIWMSQRC